MIIEAHESVSRKARWKLVRLDSGADVEHGAAIVCASEETGEFTLTLPKIVDGYFVIVDGVQQTEPKEYKWEPGSFKIVRRRR